MSKTITLHISKTMVFSRPELEILNQKLRKPQSQTTSTIVQNLSCLRSQATNTSHKQPSRRIALPQQSHPVQELVTPGSYYKNPQKSTQGPPSRHPQDCCTRPTRGLFHLLVLLVQLPETTCLRIWLSTLHGYHSTLVHRPDCSASWSLTSSLVFWVRRPSLKVFWSTKITEPHPWTRT